MGERMSMRESKEWEAVKGSKTVGREGSMEGREERTRGREGKE